MTISNNQLSLNLPIATDVADELAELVVVKDHDELAKLVVAKGCDELDELMMANKAVDEFDELMVVLDNQLASCVCSLRTQQVNIFDNNLGTTIVKMDHGVFLRH
jgi:hypothetical protein